uniref:cadherin repeat domain-containing protein n=1 Tax=Labrenzia sp. DG1229 TaxID=681847 RepID=UPI00048F8C0E
MRPRPADNVTIRAANLGGFHDKELTISVIDVVEAVAPTVVNLSTASLLESAGVGSVVATISSDGTAPVTYTIEADPDGKFRIEGSNLVLDQAIDFETDTEHPVTIRATNAADFALGAFTISVTDVAEAVAPTVVNLSTTSVSESTSVGTVVATISSDGTAPVIYTIEADPDGKFRIEGSNLVLDQAIDFETDTEHPVTIRATNAADFALGAFTISVTDVVEAVEPTVVNLSAASVPESAGIGAVVATISSDGTAPVTYTIENDPDGKFAINGNALELAATIDFATDNEHPVTIRATNAAGFEVGAFTISVTQVVSGT